MTQLFDDPAVHASYVPRNSQPGTMVRANGPRKEEHTGDRRMIACGGLDLQVESSGWYGRMPVATPLVLLAEPNAGIQPAAARTRPSNPAEWDKAAVGCNDLLGHTWGHDGSVVRCPGCSMPPTYHDTGGVAGGCGRANPEERNTRNVGASFPHPPDVLSRSIEILRTSARRHIATPADRA